VENGAADDAAVAGAPPSGRGRGFGGTVRRSRFVLGGLLLIVAVDQLTKIWAVSALSDRSVSIIGTTVVLLLTRNPGGAFGRFKGMTPVLALGAIVVSVFLFRAVRRTSDGWTVAALTLVLGGALGNLCDRIFRAPGVFTGHVVDFVKVGWWPVFNVADSCITIGAVLLVVRSLFPADG
jgi:signal peptidase II